MQVYRIQVTSWTASFRFPNMISGYQPSLRVPPVSTICGLISAALGYYLPPNEYEFAYIFMYSATTYDLETIYQFGEVGKRSLKAKSNVIRRELLIDNHLILYVNLQSIAEAFRLPYFPLLLGRSSDLATVKKIEIVELQPKEDLNLAGTVVPFIGHRLSAPIQALPTHFSDTIPRRNIGTQPFYILDWKRRHSYHLNRQGYHDQEMNLDLYWFNKENLNLNHVKR